MSSIKETLSSIGNTVTGLPKTYKAAQITKKGGSFELVDVDWKDPVEGQVAVKVIACGVCHSDSIVKEQHMPTGLPRIPGHEIIGDVVAIGPGEKRFKVGDRVGSGWHGGHCAICTSCRKGDFVTCEKQNINGIFTDGGYAEYAILRTEAIASIPTDVDPFEAAPLLCAGVTTFNSTRHMDLHPGDLVAVQGIGGLGHLAIQFSRAMGYRTVALSSSASKASLARELGAHDYVDGSSVDLAEALTKMGGAKVIICTAPSGKVIEGLIKGLAVGGQLLILAVAEGISVPIQPMIQKRLAIRGWPSGTAQDSEEAVEFAKIQGVRCRIEKYPLSKANEAYESMITGKARFRAVLCP